MTREQFDAYCGTLLAATHSVQWGGASVWKIGGKIFALCVDSLQQGDEQALISFKCTDLAFEILPERDGIIPAPYLARAKWVQLQNPAAMDEEELQAHLTIAYDCIKAKLTQKGRQELGLE